MAGLASRFANRGHDVTLITLGNGHGDRHELSPNVSRIDLDLMRGSTGWMSALKNVSKRVQAIRQATQSVSPHVLLSFCDRTNVLAGLSADSKIPVVLSERSDPNFQTLPFAWRLLRRYSYRRSGAIVVQTDSAASFFDGYQVPCHVIPSAVDPPPITITAETISESRQVIAIGRFAPEKGFERLLDAFAIINRNHPQWKLCILGDGPQRGSMQEQIKRLKISGAVSMPGWVNPVWSQLAESAVFVLPSHYEGFPSALLEAMAVGVPSIALQNQAGSRAIIDSGVNGILADDNAASIAKAIDHLIQDPGLRSQFSQAGQQVVNTFSWESMVGQYETVLRSVVNSPDALE